MIRTFGYFGGKTVHCKYIIPRLARTSCYVELFAGSLAVYLNKPLSRNNTLNDRDDLIVNLLRVIRNQPEALAEKLRFTPDARSEYASVNVEEKDPVERARQTLVMLKGNRRHVTKLKPVPSDYCLSVNAGAYQWRGFADALPPITERLLKARIENMDALRLFARVNELPADKDILIYVDPPYLPETRNAKAIYRFEMTPAQHEELLHLAVQSPHKVAISGYDSMLYVEGLHTFKQHRWRRVAYNSQNQTDREEVLWTNYEAPTEGLF